MKVGSMNIVFVTTVLVTLFASQLVGTTEQDALVNFQNQNEASTWNAVMMASWVAAQSVS